MIELTIARVTVWVVVSFGFVVAVHRQVLLRETPVSRRAFRPSANHFRYILGSVFLLTLPTMIIVAFLIWSSILEHFALIGSARKMLIGGAGTIGFVLMAWFFLRSMLLLPAAAIGAAQGLGNVLGHNQRKRAASSGFAALGRRADHVARTGDMGPSQAGIRRFAWVDEGYGCSHSRFGLRH